MSIHCPDCSSSRVRSYERGVDIVNGYVGYKAFGSAGLLAANIGADDVINKCVDCGTEFENTVLSESILSQIGRGIGGALALILTLYFMTLVLKAIIFIYNLFGEMT